MSMSDWIFHFQIAGTKIEADTKGLDVDEDGDIEAYFADESPDDNGHAQGMIYETDGDQWHWVDYDDDGVIDYNELTEV